MMKIIKIKLMKMNDQDQTYYVKQNADIWLTHTDGGREEDNKNWMNKMRGGVGSVHLA